MRLKFINRRASLKRLVRLFIVGLVITSVVPAVALSFGSNHSNVPQFLGGSKAYAPSFATPRTLLAAVLVGLLAGLITGVIGAGGGYIIAPALMSFGIRGIMAVGTDQFHIFASSLIGTFTHRRLGNINLQLAAWFVLGSILGVTLGGRANRLLYQHSPAASDAVISVVYVLVFAALGAYCLIDWLQQRHCRNRQIAGEDYLTGLARRLQALPLKPRIHFDAPAVPGGRSISIYPVIICGVVVGFAAAIMGIGGGLFIFPMYVYGLGVPTCTTVGTSVLQILFTTSYSSIVQYGIYGFVFYTLAVGMLVGSLIGVHIGSLVTKMVPSSQIRSLYALTVFAGFANRACALPSKLADLGYISLSSNVLTLLEQIGTWLFFALVGIFGFWILAEFVAGVRRNQEDKTQHNYRTNRKKLAVGMCGLALSAIFLAATLVPGSDGKTALTKVDEFFNQLAKHSANYIDQATRKTASYRGRRIKVTLRPTSSRVNRHITEEIVQLRSIAQRNGFQLEELKSGAVLVKGDLGKMADAAIADARIAFRNDRRAMEQKYRIPGHYAILHWWNIFYSLENHLSRIGRPDDADFARFIRTKVLEPAYNFRGIEPRSISQNAIPAVLLLAFYLVFTLWYGVSVFLVFEGLRITNPDATTNPECDTVTAQ
jgi:uncharacterized membrane protein YfcA